MIREITPQDFELFWPTLAGVLRAQETYALDPEMDFESAYKLWCEKPHKTFVYTQGDEILGTYYLAQNAMGPSSHICNCGYIVSSAARGKGVARTLCEHSQQVALELGYKAMQFNSVVSTNKIAVKLWQKLGFDIIGTVPKAYHHKKLGYVDSYIMYKWLALG